MVPRYIIIRRRRDVVEGEVFKLYEKFADYETYPNNEALKELSELADVDDELVILDTTIRGSAATVGYYKVEKFAVLQ